MLLEPELRARLSGGSSNSASLYELVTQLVVSRHPGGGILADVGCGEGTLQTYLGEYVAGYVGLDLVRYAGFPAAANIDFCQADLNSSRWPLPDGLADMVCSVETIEHVENPRAFMRELMRLVKPEGLVIVTTPNQLSLLSLLTLIVKKRFASFQDVHYPAHLTALLEVDLQRIASESGLSEVSFFYSLEGRLVLTPWHYPKFLARLFPRALSDTLLLVGRKPGRRISVSQHT